MSEQEQANEAYVKWASTEDACEMYEQDNMVVAMHRAFLAGRASVTVNTDLRDALELILPMARGYAAANPVGSNAAYVAKAEAAIAPTPKETT